MKKLMMTGVGVAGVFAAALFPGTGIASAAPDIVGETYSDAATAIEDDGGTAKVAVTVGSKLSQDDCIVTNAWDAPFMRDDGGEFAHNDGEVMVALNCDGDHATATNPGASVGSPAGREAKAAADEAASAEEGDLEEVSTPDE